MTCQRCGKGPAILHYTEVREGQRTKLEICAACARELGFDEDAVAEASAQPAAPPLFPGPESGGEESEAEQGIAGRRCPLCGLSGARLRDESLFGCPRCWEVFADTLDPILKRIHGAVAHRGRLPGGAQGGAVDVVELRRRLDEALRREDYEEAASLRDRLRQAGAVPEGGPADDPGGPA